MSGYTVHKCSDVLPMPGRYVLVHYCGGNWNDSGDPNKGFLWEVAKLRTNDWDRTSNPNKTPYRFDTFGALDMKPEYVDMWTELPTLPNK